MELENEVRDALKRANWRLKSEPRHRLATDIGFLMMGLRPLVMADYLPECSNLLPLLSTVVGDVWKDSAGKIMHLDECIYILHQSNLEQYMRESLSPETWLKFVILDDGPPRIATKVESERVEATLRIVQARLSRLFDTSLSSPKLLNISDLISDLDMSVPTFNGWLLGYPVIYVFRKDKVHEATRCLSSANLHLYQLRVFSKQGKPVDVLRFTIPHLDKSEPEELAWEAAFMSHMTRRAGHSIRLRLAAPRTRKTWEEL